MIFGLYSVRDKHTGFFAPQMYSNDDAAKRGFSYQVSNDDTLGFSPSDFDLYSIGSFDVSSGSVVLNPVPQFVCSGISVLKKVGDSNA